MVTKQLPDDLALPDTSDPVELAATVEQYHALRSDSGIARLEHLLAARGAGQVVAALRQALPPIEDGAAEQTSGRKWSDEQVEFIRDLRRVGVSSKRIATLLGVSQQRVDYLSRTPRTPQSPA